MPVTNIPAGDLENVSKLVQTTYLVYQNQNKEA